MAALARKCRKDKVDLIEKGGRIVSARKIPRRAKLKLAGVT